MTKQLLRLLAVLLAFTVVAAILGSLLPVPPTPSPTESGYAAELAQEPGLRVFPRGWEVRKGDQRIVWARLAAERELFSDPAVGTQQDVVVRLIVLLDSLPWRGLSKATT